MLKGWFSLSNSFVSIIPVNDPAGLKCGDKFQLQVLSNVGAPPVMTYLVSISLNISLTSYVVLILAPYGFA